MTRLQVRSRTKSDAHIFDYVRRLQRRVKATAPGTCPIAIHVASVQTAAAQTCGKCVPCRDGLPYLIGLLKEILECNAEEGTLEEIKELATMIRDTCDCVIGYDAGQEILDGLEDFADEYESHIKEKHCDDEVGQKLPCEAMCPAHVNVPAYIALVGQGDYAGAINMIRKDNPFPTACAFVCEHPCEARCRRNIIDAPINIRGIKKFAVDQLRADEVPTPTPSVKTGRKVAVIGGGPSGMTCAYFLALMGHSVTIFESHSKLGGMMRYGIPAYRFPRERLDEDIRAILGVGNIEVKLNTKVDTEMMKEISEEFDCVYVAIGAQGGKTLRLENADADGVSSAIDMLVKLGDGEYTPDFNGKNVVVIGGGNVAMDCCRTSMRCGAERVICVYRRRIDDMTALSTEIEAAVAEGVEMLTLQSPVEIEVDETGHCCGVITQPQMIGPVKRGRPAPLDANKPKCRIEADVILLAVGQEVVPEPFEEFGLQTNRNLFEVEAGLRAPGFDNVFVGGECQTGPATVIRAIAAGKVAARNIDEYLGYYHKLSCEVDVPLPNANIREAFGRVEISERPARERRRDFGGVEEEITLEEAKQECARCLRCDHYGCGTIVGGRILYV